MKHLLNKNTYTGLIFLLVAVFLMVLENKRLGLDQIKVSSGRYWDFSMLLYITSWVIFGLLALAGLLVLLRSRKANFFLSFFGIASLMEVYTNAEIYSITSLTDTTFYLLLIFGILALVMAYANWFKIKTMTFSKTLFAFTLGIVVASFSNALISYYF
ncbi:MAG: hypothetical protein JKZ03_07915 [Flavobacteriaceae bacterium]|nr:hypothetical protein [Flavobacteriaceae bacterium]